MKSFIKNRLRVLLEAGPRSRHTPVNPTGGRSNAKPTNADLNRVTHDVVSAHKKWLGNEYMNNPNSGDGLYLVTVNFKGRFNDIRTPNEKVDPGMIGMPWMSDEGVFSVYVKANSNVGYDEFDQTGKSETGSPAGDAKQKALLTLGKELIDYIRNQMDLHKDKSPEEKAKEMAAYKDETPEGLRYKYDKFEKEKKFAKNKSQITMDSEEAEIRTKLMNVVKAKVEAINNRDKELSKKLKNIESELRAKLK
tara:strand:+ start:1600 stop:2349 length:750 start_codon:yes stop_codon:yes gene_type:complete